MGKIKVLSELIANKIAAGEVVERPASVVKELVENSLDAGAQHISVSIRHGGKSLIRVKDDGHGMDRDDARSCLLRHATSKLSDVDDIENIETLGFRGEALPSIGSVSRFTLTTRRREDDTATLMHVSGGSVESVGECVAPPGTVIEVTDLFFNTPARKKFLKSDAAEYNAVADVFNTLALSSREVSFSLIRNDIQAADYPACSDLLQRIEQLYLPGFAGQLYPITVDRPDFRMTGYIGTPENTRVNRTGQKFFINGRPIQSISLSSALSRAYDEFLPQRRFPVAVLFLDIERTYVDVNVHPTKREVRIRSERLFQDVIVKAVRKTLREQGLSGEYPLPNSSFSGSGEKPYSTENSSRIPFSRIKESVSSWPERERGSRPLKDRIQGEPVFRDTGLFHKEEYKDAASPAQAKNPFETFRAVGQVLDTYVIAETQDGFAVFDQHAAHERILYEELCDAIERKKTHSQKVIVPITLHLTLQENALMEKYGVDFQKIGFNINSLGGKTFSIDAVPSCMADADAAKAVKDTIHELMESQAARSWESRQHALAAILACKTYAVKAGKILDPSEMEHLIVKLGSSQNPHTCPHGRPTVFYVTKDELEKKFKRK